MSRVETVKKWRIPRDFTIAASEKTPTPKVRHKKVNDQYDDLIEDDVRRAPVKPE